jgi:hypothetical protein
MSFDQVPHNTIVRVNEVQYQAFGVGNANKGQLTTQLEHDFDFDCTILAPFLIVGYPTYSEYKDGATDLFKPPTLNGGYKYQRSYKFSNGAEFSSYHNISFDKENGLQGVFSARNFPAKAFDGKWAIADLVETFIPHGPGAIKSIMGVEWVGNTGKRLQAVIQSEYYLNHNRELPGLRWHHVTFETEDVRSTTYVQSEKITVINNLDFGRPLNMLKAMGQTQPVAKATKELPLVDKFGFKNGVHGNGVNGGTNGFAVTA